MHENAPVLEASEALHGPPHGLLAVLLRAVEGQLFGEHEEEDHASK